MQISILYTFCMNQQDRPTIDRRIWSHSVQIVTIYHVKWLISDMTFIWILSMITSNMGKIWLYSSLPLKNVKNWNLTEYDFLWIFSLQWLWHLSVIWKLGFECVSNWQSNMFVDGDIWIRKWISPSIKIQLKTKLFDPRSYTFCSIKNSIFSVSPKTKNMS